MLLGGKRREVSFEYLRECKVIEILFSVPLFDVKDFSGEDSFCYERCCSQTWNKIWHSFVMKDRSNLRWVGKAIVESIRFSCENVDHLSKINKWVQEQALNDEELITTCIGSGLLEALFLVISYIKRSKKNTKNLAEFFMTIKILLGQYQGNELSNSTLLMNSLIQDNYINDSLVSELCLDCLTSILKFRNDSNYAKFCNLLKQTENIDLKLKLLSSMQNVLKQKEIKKACQEGFIRAKALSSLKEVIIACDINHGEIITVWVNVMECVRFLIEENPICKKSLQDFDFSQVATTIRSDRYKQIRSEIYIKTIESLLCILFETNNLAKPQCRIVKTPEVIPLVIELLSDCESIQTAQEYFNHLNVCLEDSYNAAHFANYRTTDLLLDAFVRTSSAELLKFISNTLPLVICHHITPQELKKIIEISQIYNRNTEKRMILFKCLANAVKNSCCHTEHFKFGANHTCLSPTRYFCFRSSKSLLKFTLESNENLIPNKDFSMFFWVYPDNSSRNSVLIILSGPSNSSLMISVISGNIVIEYFQDKIIFAVGGIEPVKGIESLVKNQWNLVGIVFKSMSGLLFKNDRGEIEIFINYKKIETEVRGKVIRPKEIFNKICIGNTENLENPFMGRIMAFYIMKKQLSSIHYQEIFFLSFQYNLGFNPDALSTSEVINADKNTLKFIYENLTFVWHPRSRLPEVTTSGKGEIVDECERFNGVSIIEAIAANGGLKIFLPIIKECAENRDERKSLINLLAIVADVCLAQSVEMILDEDFFNILTFILQESLQCPDVKLVDALINIVGHLEWNTDHNSQSFKSLFLNKKLWKDLDEESTNHYTGTLSLNIKKHFKCDPETLYKIFDQLSYIQQNFCEAFLEIWQNLIPDTIDAETADGILILIFTMYEKNLSLLLKFIEMLYHKYFKRDSFDSMHFSIIYLMKQLKDGHTQASLLKFLLKLIDDYCEEMGKDKRVSIGAKDDFEFISTLSFNVDRYLDRNILPETFDELIHFCKKAVDTNDKKAEKFVNFFEIITSRLEFCTHNQEFCDILINQCQNEQFSLLLYDTKTFPYWLLPLHDSIPQKMEELALKIFVTNRSQRNFNKLRRFLIAVSEKDRINGLTWSFKFYHKLLKALSNNLDKSKNVAVQMLDFFGVLEDLLDNKESSDVDIDLSVYIPLINHVIKTSEDIYLISSSFPDIPGIGFDALISAFKEQVYPELNEETIYLRDGGFLRLVLKFIFIGLNTDQHNLLIRALVRVLKGGNTNMGYLTSSNEQRNLWDTRFNQVGFERYSQFYASFHDKPGESIHSLKFLAMYIIAECSELIKDGKNPIIGFLKEFIAETDALQFIESKVRPTIIELDYFYKLLEKEKVWLYSTGRCRLKLMSRNKNLDLLSNFLTLIPQYPDSKTFMSDLKEMSQRYKSVKDSESDLQELLISESWITRVHFFFLASTSMKLNFISRIVVNPSSSPTYIREDSSDRLDKFIHQKQEFFKKCKKTYEQRLDLSRRMAQKNYKEFCQNFENLKRVLTGSQSGKYRIREVADKSGKMPLIEKWKNKDLRSSPGKARLSLTSPQQISTKKLNEKLNESDVEFLESSDEDEVYIQNNLEDVIRFDCERIKLDSSVFGFIEVSQDYMLYISEGKEKPKDDFYFGSALEFTVLPKKTEKIWKINDIKEIFPRRFIHRITAFEVFLKNGKTLFFNLFNEEQCKKALDFFRGLTRKHGKIVQDAAKLFQSYKKLWVKGAILNMDYLMILNKLSSRSFNDISQYPIFPWVLKDYSCKSLRLEDPDIYRNFSYPIGAQSEEGKEEADRKYSNFADSETDSFHYGSHYSSAGIVLHFLVRLDPYTDMAKNLQGGSFDVPDRLFYSVQAAWESGQGTTGDVKELVPQLFYLAEILTNLNQEDFGTRQDFKTVKDVELPAWASSSVDFIIKHRRALESAHVSNHLHEWIDLIFGFKQKGDPAIVSYNKFNSLTYEDSYKALYKSTKDLESIQGMVEQVVHFGQTPVQLLKVPHPAKDLRPRGVELLERWKVEAMLNESEVVRASGSLLALLANNQGIWIVKAHNSSLQVLALKDLNMEKVPSAKLENVRELKLNDWEEAVQWKYNSNSSPLTRSPEQYCLWGEEYLVSGFHIDNSFKVHNLKGTLIKSVHHHAGLVTCVTSTSELLFTGSMDTSISAWSTFGQKDEKIKPYNIYLGHSEAVVQLAVQDKYDVLLSLSVNGFVLLHEVRSSQCIRRFAYSQPIRLVAASEYGILALYIKKIGIKLLTFNGSELESLLQRADIKFMKFSENGECLIFGSSDEFYFVDVIEPHRIYEKKCRQRADGFEIETFVFSANRDLMVLGFNSEDEFKIWKF